MCVCICARAFVFIIIIIIIMCMYVYVCDGCNRDEIPPKCAGDNDNAKNFGMCVLDDAPCTQSGLTDSVEQCALGGRSSICRVPRALTA